MPLDYTPVSDLNSTKKVWKIRAFLARTWQFYPKDKPGVTLGIEVILVDEKGDRIQASVKQKFIQKFRKELPEGECREIMNFEVVDNDGDYRGTMHPYKINFLFSTCVKPCDHIQNIPRFNFIPFAEINAKSYTNNNVFIDILGEIVGMSEITEKTFEGSTSKLLNIQLKDLSGEIIDCTLWAKHAEDVHTFVKSQNDGPIIFLGSLMRTKKYNGKLSVQNSLFSTKLFINRDIEEISAFKSQMQKSESNNGPTVLQLITPNLSRKTVDSFPLSSWKTIEEFTIAQEESTCVAFATILEFQKEKPWYYVGCTQCFTTVSEYFNPKTEEYEPGKYSCETCNKDDVSTSMRYKVHVKVADNTSTASFLLFDREVMQLIHKSAYELLEQQVQFNREGEIPQDLLGLQGRTIAWIIRLNATQKTYRQSSFKVVKLTEESEIIQKFQDNVILKDTALSELPNISSMSNSVQIDNVSSEAKENSSVHCSPVTPSTKRRLKDIIGDEEGQESSIKPKAEAKAASKTTSKLRKK